MSTPQKICAYYSHGPHYARMLKHLRATYPAATIVAIVPPAYPRDALRGLANEVQWTNSARYGLAAPGALKGLIGDIRRQRFDLIVVMFDSPKLRLLARAVGAKSRRVYTVDGRLEPVSTAVLGSLGRDLLRRLSGTLLYARLWCIVHLQRVGK